MFCNFMFLRNMVEKITKNKTDVEFEIFLFWIKQISRSFASRQNIKIVEKKFFFWNREILNFLIRFQPDL